MIVKAIYENGVLRPLKKLDLKEKEEVELRIVPNIVARTKGIIKVDPKIAKEIAESNELSTLGI